MSSTIYHQSTDLTQGPPTNNWPVVLGLFLLLALPGIPAIFIVGSVIIGTGTNEMPLEVVNSAYLSSPWAVIVHGSAGVAFFVSAPWQFSPKLRYNHIKLHRHSGYLVFLSGYIMAISGVWMHLTLTPDDQGPRFVGLIVMSAAMCVSFSLALKYIIQRDIVSHKRWVIRALAITLGAITHLFIEVTLSMTLGQIEGLQVFLTQWLHDYGRITAVVVNLFIAQRIMR